MKKNHHEIISKIVQNALSSGVLSVKDHDLLMVTAHSDGQIDSFESTELSKIFTAIQSGKIRILDEEEHKQIENFKTTSQVVKEDTVTVDTQSTSNNLYKNIDKLSFDCIQERILKVRLKDKLWIKSGSMMAYEGAISFRREGIGEHGFGKLIKRSISGESLSLTAAEGNGTLYLADNARSIQIIDVSKEPIFVQADNLLAFEDSVSWDVKPLFNFSAALSGGLFHVILSGIGYAAICTDFQPLVLEVNDGKSIFADANSTVAWSAGVSPALRADISLQTLIGRTSGDTFQLRFNGKGYVIVQTQKLFNNIKTDSNS